MLNENGDIFNLESLRGKSSNKLVISPSAVGDIRSLYRDKWSTYTVMEPQRQEQVVHFAGNDFSGSRIPPFSDLDSAPGQLRLPNEFFNEISLSGGLWHLVYYQIDAICDHDLMVRHQRKFSLPQGEEGMLAFEQNYGQVASFRNDDEFVVVYPRDEDSRFVKVTNRYMGQSQFNYLSWDIAANLFYSLRSGLKKGGRLLLEEFIGPLGFDSQERIEHVITAAGLNICQIGNLSARQSCSDAIKKQIRAGGYGTAFYVVAERPYDDDTYTDNFTLPQPEADLEYA